MVFRIKREIFIGRFLQFLVVLVTAGLMFLRDFDFLIISLIFFSLAAFSELVLIKKFNGNSREQIKKSDKVGKRVIAGILWINANILYIRKYGNDIYDFRKAGILSGLVSYLVMFTYVLIAFLLYPSVAYYSFIIYILPIVTNLAAFFTHKYEVKKA